MYTLVLNFTGKSPATAASLFVTHTVANKPQGGNFAIIVQSRAQNEIIDLLCTQTKLQGVLLSAAVELQTLV